MQTRLEHTNLTVANPEATAAWMQDIFGWHIRWAGDAIHGGRTIHVGTDTQYLALYTPASPAISKEDNYETVGGLNHIAVVTDDLEGMEARIKKAGFQIGEHYDYEPGRRFYFHDRDNIEYEVVQYD